MGSQKVIADLRAQVPNNRVHGTAGNSTCSAIFEDAPGFGHLYIGLERILCTAGVLEYMLFFVPPASHPVGASQVCA